MHFSDLTRRNFLSWTTHGLGTAAAASLLLRDQQKLFAEARREPRPPIGSTAPQAGDPWPHHTPRVKRAIHICLCGGLSQVDSFDYKPELEKFHGQKYGGVDGADVFFGQIGLLRKSDWEFRQRGESGLWISELFPHLAEVADELTVIRSMFAESSSHTPATMHENSGFRLNGFPTLGSWLSYGLGCETDELPAFVVLPDPRVRRVDSK